MKQKYSLNAYTVYYDCTIIIIYYCSTFFLFLYSICCWCGCFNVCIHTRIRNRYSLLKKKKDCIIIIMITMIIWSNYNGTHLFHIGIGYKHVFHCLKSSVRICCAKIALPHPFKSVSRCLKTLDARRSVFGFQIRDVLGKRCWVTLRYFTLKTLAGFALFLEFSLMYLNLLCYQPRFSVVIPYGTYSGYFRMIKLKWGKLQKLMGQWMTIFVITTHVLIRSNIKYCCCVNILFIMNVSNQN